MRELLIGILLLIGFMGMQMLNDINLKNAMEKSFIRGCMENNKSEGYCELRAKIFIKDVLKAI